MPDNVNDQNKNQSEELNECKKLYEQLANNIKSFHTKQLIADIALGIGTTVTMAASAVAVSTTFAPPVAAALFGVQVLGGTLVGIGDQVKEKWVTKRKGELEKEKETFNQKVEAYNRGKEGESKFQVKEQDQNIDINYKSKISNIITKVTSFLSKIFKTNTTAAPSNVDPGTANTINQVSGVIKSVGDKVINSELFNKQESKQQSENVNAEQKNQQNEDKDKQINQDNTKSNNEKQAEGNNKNVLGEKKNGSVEKAKGLTNSSNRHRSTSFSETLLNSRKTNQQGQTKTL